MAKQKKEKLHAEDQESVNNETLEQENTPVEEDQVESTAKKDDEGMSLEEQLEEAKDKYLRLYSEFDNFRRRTSKERLDLINSAGREVIESLLPVLDDFERAMKASDTSDEDEGMKLIYNKMKKALTDKGLKDMGTKQGDDFDDEFHEAVTQIPAPDKSLEGKIVDVIEPGYFMGEKVIRFAKVVTGAKS